MKKSLIALAVASVFTAPAIAATANVDIGGTINLSLDYLDGDRPASPTSSGRGGNWNVSSNSSNIFFKGAEDLGGGMKAVWQIQTFFTAGGTGNGDTGVMGEAELDGVGSGNTFVGLSGGFGTVVLGKHDAPARSISRRVDLFDAQIGDNRNLVARSGRALANLVDDVLTNPGHRVYSGGFDLRPNNVVAYVSPNLNGFSAAVAYVTNVGNLGDLVDMLSPGGTGTQATADDSVDAWSASLKYENGPLMIGLGYQVHNLSNLNTAWTSLGGTGSFGDENVWRLAASYKLGDVRLVGFYQQEDELNRINTVTGTITNNGIDRTTWGLGAAYGMGPFTLKAQYYNTDDLHAANTGANMWALGVDYTMSKRTRLQFAYATTDNESGASYSAFGGGHGDNPGTVNGGSPSGFSVGVRHSF